MVSPAVGVEPVPAQLCGVGIQAAQLVASIVGQLAAGELFAIGVQFVHQVVDDFDVAAVHMELARWAGFRGLVILAPEFIFL